MNTIRTDIAGNRAVCSLAVVVDSFLRSNIFCLAECYLSSIKKLDHFIYLNKQNLGFGILKVGRLTGGSFLQVLLYNGITLNNTKYSCFLQSDSKFIREASIPFCSQ